MKSDERILDCYLLLESLKLCCKVKYKDEIGNCWGDQRNIEEEGGQNLIDFDHY